MPFRFLPTRLPGVVLVEPVLFQDGRGFFLETYAAREFAAAGLPDRFAQDNLSRSAGGVVRGLHYQKAAAGQGKLVTVVAGAIFDVAVDIRRGSPTFGRWTGHELSEQNRLQLYLPPGCAHGFCVVSRQADVAYKATAAYAPGLERGIVWNDPAIGIAWPVSEPLLSERDRTLPTLELADNDFVWQPGG